MNALIIVSLIVVLIAAIGRGAVRRSNQHLKSALFMGGWPSWWPEKPLKIVSIVQMIFFVGSIVLTIVALVMQVLHLDVALVVMFVVLLIFLWLIGNFLGAFLLSTILKKYAKKRANLDLPEECFWNAPPLLWEILKFILRIFLNLNFLNYDGMDNKYYFLHLGVILIYLS